MEKAKRPYVQGPDEQIQGLKLKFEDLKCKYEDLFSANKDDQEYIRKLKKEMQEFREAALLESNTLSRKVKRMISIMKFAVWPNDEVKKAAENLKEDLFEFFYPGQERNKS